MAGHDNKQTGHDLLAPVDEDMERYRGRLVDNSPRLFSSRENSLDMVRLLSANGGSYLFVLHP